MYKFKSLSLKETHAWPSKSSISSFFSFSSHLENIFKGQLFKNYWVTFVLDDIKKLLISKHAKTYVLLTWIKICHMPYARFHMICHALFLLKTTIPYLTWLFSLFTYLNSTERKKTYMCFHAFFPSFIWSRLIFVNY